MMESVAFFETVKIIAGVLIGFVVWSFKRSIAQNAKDQQEKLDELKQRNVEISSKVDTILTQVFETNGKVLELREWKENHKELYAKDSARTDKEISDLWEYVNKFTDKVLSR